MLLNNKAKQLKMQEKYMGLFENYPDVVDLPTLCQMIKASEAYVRPRLQNGTIRSFYLYSNHVYMIPKVWAIEFLMSPEYEKDKPLLKHKMEVSI